MISITIRKANGEYKGISSIGHADYAKSGSDIVCSAVSVLVINTLNAIESLTDDTITDNSSNQNEGIIRADFDRLSDKSNILIDAMIMGLEEIQKQYGRKYLTLSFADEEEKTC